MNVTFAVSNEDAARISAAFGKAYGLKDDDDNPRGASTAEVKEQIMNFVNETVTRIEAQEAAEAAKENITAVTAV